MVEASVLVLVVDAFVLPDVVFFLAFTGFELSGAFLFVPDFELFLLVAMF